MHSDTSDFALIGTRDYVHGPSIFEAFRDRVLKAAGPGGDGGFSLGFLRVNRTIHANGAITVLRADELRPHRGTPAAEMSCNAGGRSWYVALHQDNPAPITRREPAREKDYVRELRLTGPFAGEAELVGVRTQGDLFQAVIEANKQVHLKTLTGDPWSAKLRFRFVYCLDYTCPPSLGIGTGAVRVLSEGFRDAGEYRFSLTSLDLDLAGCNSTFKLCFASQDMRSIDPAGTKDS